MATRRAGQSGEGLQREQAADKLRKKKLLFIQQFEKEAQERLNEMESKLDKLLTTVDRAFKIEMMKLPQSLHSSLIKDLMTAEQTSVGEVTMAITSGSPEISKPLSRKPSKKGKVGLAAVGQESTAQIKSDDGNKKRCKKKLQQSNSTGNLRSASTVSVKRTQSRVIKLSDQPFQFNCKMKPSRSLSDDLSGLATATITTSLGETLYLSEENKDQVNLELLDNQALCQMQKIKELMDYLSNKVRLNNTQ